MSNNYYLYLFGLILLFITYKKDDIKKLIISIYKSSYNREINFNYLLEINNLFQSQLIEEIIYVLGNSGGDLDSIISAYMTSLGENIENNVIYFDKFNNPKINKTTKKIFIPVINIKRGTYFERLEGKFIFNKFNINDKDFFYINDNQLSKNYLEKSKKKISFILVDFSELDESQFYLEKYVEKVIDHHLQNISKFPNLKKRIIEYPIGSCTTLVLSHYFLDFFPENIIPIQFAITPILIDTSNFKKEYFGFKWDNFDLKVYNVITKNSNLTKNEMTIYYNNIRSEMFNIEKTLELGINVLLRKDSKNFIWGIYHIKFVVFTISFENMYKYYGKEKILEEEKNYCDENVSNNIKCIIICFAQNEAKYTFYTPNFKIKNLNFRIEKAGKGFLFNIKQDNKFDNYYMMDAKEGVTRKIIEPLFKEEFKNDK